MLPPETETVWNILRGGVTLEVDKLREHNQRAEILIADLTNAVAMVSAGKFEKIEARSLVIKDGSRMTVQLGTLGNGGFADVFRLGNEPKKVIHLGVSPGNGGKIELWNAHESSGRPLWRTIR
ncbi:MAG: hypothetical protein FJ403_14235 [Verrucomicrobia bacterium]|nr:hypothetical protein [Verrucomicrobiota bacterium]